MSSASLVRFDSLGSAPSRAASALVFVALTLCATGASAQSVANVPSAQAAPAGAAQRASQGTELQLYGVALRNSRVDDFIAAAKAAGGRVVEPGPDGHVAIDVRAAGVPALQRLTVRSEGPTFVSAQFVIKSYGEDNEALRRALVDKYGLPSTADGARRPFPSFAARFAPRGTFDWEFAGGMKLVYRQPALGDTTLSYVDVERARRLDAVKGPSTERGSTTTPSSSDNRF